MENYWSYKISKITVFFSFGVRKEDLLEIVRHVRTNVAAVVERPECSAAL